MFCSRFTNKVRTFKPKSIEPIRLITLKLKNFNCTKRIEENIMDNNNSYKNMDHFIKE